MESVNGHPSDAGAKLTGRRYTLEGITRISMAIITTTHPLEPLTPEEIAAAVAIVRVGPASSEHMRFVMVKLHEPGPEVSLSYQPGDNVPREVFMSLLDKTNGVGKAYEAIVNLSEERVRSWRHIEGVQPSIMFEEFFAS